VATRLILRTHLDGNGVVPVKEEDTVAGGAL
jgi:ATP-dependent Clp protease adapter protein ClpS